MQKEIEGLSTGFANVDNVIRGLKNGQLIVIASRPAIGKSAFAINLACNISTLAKMPIAYFSLELTGTELSQRLLIATSKVSRDKFKNKDFNEEDLKKISNATLDLSKRSIFINDSASITLSEIENTCLQKKETEGLSLVIIDYIQLINISNSIPKNQLIPEIMKSLKTLAKKLDCPVIALSQLSRDLENRSNRRPVLTDFPFQSFASIEENADIVMMVYRDDIYKDFNATSDDTAEIIVRKNQNGELGTANLKWEGRYISFEN